MLREKSDIAFEELKKLLPGGVNSPVRSFPKLDITPLVIEKANLDMIQDIDQNEWIDFGMSWGSLILGHADPEVVWAAQEQIAKGSSYGITSLVEKKIASSLTSVIPSLDQVRFVSSGTEATMSAIRLARGYTKRNKIIKFIGNYHGHADYLMVSAGSYLNLLDNKPSSLGIPQESVQHTICLPFNDKNALEEFFNTYPYLDDLAAAIVEPIAGNIGVVPASKEFLERLREKTMSCGALMIMDEVITGFRVGLDGAQGLYGIAPDLTCYGKIIGGGFPAACFGGRKEIMQHLAPVGSIFQAGTLSGNPVAMSAGYVVLERLKEPGFYERLEKQTREFLEPIEAYIQEKQLNMCVQRCASMFSFFFGTRKVCTSDDLKKIDFDSFKRFFAYLFDKGIYLSPSPFESHFLSTAHSKEHLEYTQKEIMQYLASNPIV